MVNRFVTTRWSVVLLAGREVSLESEAALENLCRAYWQPICAFARRKGWGEEDAKDLTQEFFALLLARKDFGAVDPARGKFRTFLLSAFTHFLANQYDRANAQKRGGACQVMSLDQFSNDDTAGGLAVENASPAKVYDLHWAQAIAQTALRTLKEEFSTPDKQAQFVALKQFLTASATGEEYAAVAAKLQIEESSVPVLVHRLRRRYRELVRQEVAQTVSSPLELHEEMRYLFEVLNQ